MRDNSQNLPSSQNFKTQELYFSAACAFANSMPFSMLAFNSAVALDTCTFSNESISPHPNTFSSPFSPNSHLEAKNANSGITSEATYAHSTIPFSPLIALKHELAIFSAANAMLNVAEPAPAFASTTSVPAFWILVTKAVNSSPSNGFDSFDGYSCCKNYPKNDL